MDVVEARAVAGMEPKNLTGKHHAVSHRFVGVLLIEPHCCCSIEPLMIATADGFFRERPKLVAMILRRLDLLQPRLHGQHVDKAEIPGSVTEKRHVIVDHMLATNYQVIVRF